MALFVSGCVCDNMDSDYYDPDAVSGDVLRPYITVQVDLPSVNASRRNIISRTDKHRSSFDDGDEQEYALAPGHHHVALIFEKKVSEGSGDARTLAAILFLDNMEETLDGLQNSITLRVTKLFSDLTDGIINNSFTTEELKDFLKNKESIVILNTDIAFNHAPIGSTFDEIREYEVVKPFITVDGKKYFTMSSSVYRDDDGNEVCAVDIKSENVYDNSETAKSNPAIVTCVDRLAAKLTVDFSKIIQDGGSNIVASGDKYVMFYTESNESTGVTSYNQSGYTVRILGYGANATEPGELLFKKINLVNDGNAFAGWNDFDNKRSYWCNDNHYLIQDNVQDYPHQFRHALDNLEIRAYEDDASVSFVKDVGNSGFMLRYKSFQDIIDDMDKSLSSPIYTTENTYYDSGQESETLGSYGYYSAGTHIIVACQLAINGYPTANSDGSYYRDENDIFYNEADKLIDAKLKFLNKSVFASGKSEYIFSIYNWLGLAGSSTEKVSIKWSKNSLLRMKTNDANREVTSSDFALISARISGGDGKMLIVPDEVNRNAIFYLANEIVANPEEVMPECTLDFNRLVSLLYAMVGPVDHFSNGYMYYGIPVLHSVPKLEPDSWKTCGHIGVVRNHWYDISITNIRNIGIPIDNPEQPIIPLMDASRANLEIDAKVAIWGSILPWQYEDSEIEW